MKIKSFIWIMLILLAAPLAFAATGSVSLIVSADQGPAPLIVTASALYTPITGGPADSIDLDCGNGEKKFGSGNSVTDACSYTTPGIYEIIATAHIGGDSAKARKTIIVDKDMNIPPYVSLDAMVKEGNAPLPVTFAAVGLDTDGKIDSYSWNFGDGSTVITENGEGPSTPTYIFQTEGTYIVRVGATDNQGATAYETVTINVNPVADIPVVVVTATPDVGQAPLDVEFLADVVNVQKGAVISDWTWEFGDGTTSKDKGYVKHKFENPGIYPVTLTVTDSKGLTGTIKKTIIADTKDDQVPFVTLEADVTEGGSPLTANFIALGRDLDGKIDSYSWNFGDGSTVITENGEGPSIQQHIFQTEGTYIVRVGATDNAGNTAYETTTIEVTKNEAPTAEIKLDRDIGVIPFEVKFEGIGKDSDGKIVGYEWNFGDGTVIVNEQNPTHTFTQAGIYIVRLGVKDEKGAVGYATKTVIADINVNEAPFVTLDVSSDNVKIGEAITFTALGKDTDGKIDSYSWNFGDGSTVITENGEGPSIQTYTYSNPGVYIVRVSATDEDKATAYETKTVIVDDSNKIPFVSLTPMSENIEVGETIVFTALGRDLDGNIEQYRWSFEDTGESTIDKNSGASIKEHTFAKEGSYIVRVGATDNQGATAYETATVNVGIPAVITAQITASATSGEAPLTVIFTGMAIDANGVVDDKDVQYYWNFGDGQADNTDSSQVVHIYEVKGEYTAELTVIDERNGQTDTARAKISVDSIVPPEQSDCQVLTFTKDWNYITLEVQPFDPKITTVLKDLNYEIAWHEGSEYKFFLEHNQIRVGEFDTMAKDQNYWIFSNEDKQIAVCGGS